MPAASEFSVRAALPSDARAIADLWVRCWVDTYPNAERGITREAIAERIAFRNSGDGVARLQERLGDGRADHACFVAISNEGGIVGFCCPYADSEGVQHVGALYVDARWHGRGPGPALLDQILTWRDPARPVVLSVAAYNDRAIAFYRRHGFELASASEAPCHADELIPAISMIHRG